MSRQYRRRLDALEQSQAPLSVKLANFDGDYGKLSRDELEEIIGIKNPTHEQLMTIINEGPKT